MGEIMLIKGQMQRERDKALDDKVNKHLPFAVGYILVVDYVSQSYLHKRRVESVDL